MSLTASVPVDEVFHELLQELDVVYSNETFDRGERKRNPVPGKLELAPVQLTARTLKYLPEGVYNTKDFKFYQVGQPVLVAHDVIEYDGNSYSVEDVQDRSIEGNYTYYLARLIA